MRTCIAGTFTILNGCSIRFFVFLFSKKKKGCETTVALVHDEHSAVSVGRLQPSKPGRRSKHSSLENAKDTKSTSGKMLPENNRTQSLERSECMNSETANVDLLPLSGGKQMTVACQVSSESISDSDTAEVIALPKIGSKESAGKEWLSSDIGSASEMLKSTKSENISTSESESTEVPLHKYCNKQSGKGEDLSSEDSNDSDSTTSAKSLPEESGRLLSAGANVKLTTANKSSDSSMSDSESTEAGT